MPSTRAINKQTLHSSLQQCYADTGKTAVVIPACNEEDCIGSVLDNLAQLSALHIVIPVLNGCTDNTRKTILEHSLILSNAVQLSMIEYPLPFGIDVPRTVGADCAIKLGADAILFVDGDLTGEYTNCLQQLLHDVLCRHQDLALTNCYPYIEYRSQTAKTVLYYREKLNRALKLFPTIGLATPSHGPHCVSRRLIETIGADCLSIPPLMLAKAAKANLQVCVAATLNNRQWQSAQRGDAHNEKIADTIIGDCIASLEYLEGRTITRSEHGKVYLGYRTL